MKAVQSILGGMLAVFSVLAADDIKVSPVGAIYIKTGIMVYSNESEDYLTFEIIGQKPHAFQKDGFFFTDVNDKTIQFNIAPLSHFVSSEEINKRNELNILLAHQKYELKSIEENIKSKLEVKTENKKCKSGRLFLVWSFKMPKQYDKVKMQLFVTAVTKNHVLILNGVISKDAEFKEIYEILENAINSLDLKQIATNPIAIRDSIKNEK